MKLKKYITLGSGALLLLLAGNPNAHAQGSDSALLDVLVKKKVLTAKEAEAIKADYVQEQAAAAPSSSEQKLKIGDWVQEMAIGGDIRLRYQYDTRQFQVPPPGGGNPPTGSQRSRWSFRLRLNDEFKLANNFFGGVQLATNLQSDSSSQTFGDPTTGSGFAKYPIYISRAYIGWNATDWMTFVGGKQPNPFYTTDLVWDPDINPDGLVETVRFHKLFSAGGNSSSSSGGGYSKDESKDGKGYKAVESVEEELPWELTLNAGQFIFAYNNQNGGRINEPGLNDTDVSTSVFLFVTQLVGTWHFNNSLSATVAPGFLTYNAGRIANAANDVSFSSVEPNPTASTPVNTSYLGESRDLAIVTAPGDVSLKLGSVPVKFYWDFAWNTQGRDRDHDIYKINGSGGSTTPSSTDYFAYLAGLQFGQNKKQGDLSLNVNWRQDGIASVDPNLNDNDFALGYLNMRGVKAGLFYNLTDFATFGVTYYYAWNLRDNLHGGYATTGPAIANVNQVQVVQVDLNVKF